jgi:hypothetical protein
MPSRRRSFSPASRAETWPSRSRSSTTATHDVSTGSDCDCSTTPASPRTWFRRRSYGSGDPRRGSTPPEARCGCFSSRSPALWRRGRRSSTLTSRPEAVVDEDAFEELLVGLDVRAALDELSSKHRGVLELHFDCGLTRGALGARGGPVEANVEVRKTGIGRVSRLESGEDLPILPKGEYYELWCRPGLCALAPPTGSRPGRSIRTNRAGPASPSPPRRPGGVPGPERHGRARRREPGAHRSRGAALRTLSRRAQRREVRATTNVLWPSTAP